MKELKANDPVMWEKREYQFVEYSPHSPSGENQRAIIKRQGAEVMYEVLVKELDLIREFDFGA
tara:strand:- start:273 stop:461 length:189 start_codon:yes stop_codon:yes gene_type:complete